MATQKKPDLIADANKALNDPKATPAALEEQRRLVSLRVEELNQQIRHPPTPASGSDIRKVMDAEREATIERDTLARLRGLINSALQSAKVRAAKESYGVRREMMAQALNSVTLLERELAAARVELDSQVKAWSGNRLQTQVALDTDLANHVAQCLLPETEPTRRISMVRDLAGR